MKPKLLTCIALILGTLALSSCNREKDFSVAFNNRNSNAIAAIVDGTDHGVVGAGTSRQFTIGVRVLDSSVNTNYSGYGDSPYYAEVSCSARDVVTGKLSRERRVTLYTDRVTTIEINDWDFY